MKPALPILSCLLLSLAAACGSDGTGIEASTETLPISGTQAMASETPHQTATFGAGCYWCAEAVLEQLDGVIDVTSGFMGGHVDNPTYHQVSSGATGDAEVVQVQFDPTRIRYEDLLDWFWRLHDPTTLNRQGADVGTQYRSVIFVADEQQRREAEASLAAAQASGAFDAPIVTQIVAASHFTPAAEDHQDFYRSNRGVPYCQVVIRPKLEKLGLKH